MTPPASASSLLLIGSYASAEQPGIHLLNFDEATGALTACGAYTGIVNPSFIITHPNQRWLYAVSEVGQEPDGPPAQVWALHFEREARTLRPLNHQPSGGDSPCHLQLDRTGQWLLVSNFSSGTLAVLPVQSDGALGELTDLIQHQGHSLDPKRQSRPHPHSATLTPDNRFALVADLGIDQLVVYQFDSNVGKLSPHSQLPTRPGAGPRHMTFHPNGYYVYVTNELDGTVGVYSYEAANGQLSEIQTVDCLPPEAPKNLVADIQIDASGQWVYVSNRGHNSIAAFEVEANGRLGRMTLTPCGGKWPRNIALAPSGDFLLAANQASNEVSVLRRRAGAVALDPAYPSAAIIQPTCVQFVTDR